MPWLLDTPLQVGDMSSGGPYTHANPIHTPNHRDDLKIISGGIIYGTMPAAKFIAGTVQPAGQDSSFEISGSDYDTLTTTHTTQDGELTYDAVSAVSMSGFLIQAVRSFRRGAWCNGKD